MRKELHYSVCIGLTLCVVSLNIATSLSLAQEPRAQQLTAPPPMKAISREERARIDESKDPKARVRTMLELAEAHLAKAEAKTSQDDYAGASAELGRYWMLIEGVLDYLNPMSHDSNKTRDLYKRLELTLRAQGPRLALMRRNTPLEYAVWIKEIEEFARNGRTEALNSFYGHTVVRDGQQKPEKQTKGVSPTPERKPQ